MTRGSSTLHQPWRREPISAVEVDQLAWLLCDADGNLFPSEGPAFIASTSVTNQFLREYGVGRQFSPDELRSTTTGKNFRATTIDLACRYGLRLAPDLAARYPDRLTHEPRRDAPMLTARDLDRSVTMEKEAVTT